MTGLEIYKLLPKTNCKKCGYPTCLAFAMALAAKKASLEKCPDVTPESRLALEASAEPPIRTVALKDSAGEIKLGGETVLFRHEKTFWNPCGIAVYVSDAMPEETALASIAAASGLSFERVGEKVRTEFILVENFAPGGELFARLAAAAAASGTLVILSSPDTGVLKKATDSCPGRKFLLSGAAAGDFAAHLALASSVAMPLAVECVTLDECAAVSAAASASGFRDIVFRLKTASAAATLDTLVQLRRLALKKNLRVLGYPAMVFTSAFLRFAENESSVDEAAEAAQYIEKYASIVVVKTPSAAAHLALVSLRQNIYTDPQKPVSVEAKLYKIGAPTARSPILVTTNFSLTYYSVAPEIESSKVPCHLLVVDTEGMSVLTAWSAEKFSAEIIYEAMKKTGVESVVSHRRMIIPGYVAVISGKLADVSGWDVVVGPKEASGLPKFLKSFSV